MQYAAKSQLYRYQPPIPKTIQIRQLRHVGYCWRSKDVLISDDLLWNPAYGCANVIWLTRTYNNCTDAGCSLEDLPKAMGETDEWRESV